jgi:nucleoside phosphorylase
MLPNVGMPSAAAVTAMMIERYSPKSILMTGICAVLKKKLI